MRIKKMSINLQYSAIRYLQISQQHMTFWERNAFDGLDSEKSII